MALDFCMAVVLGAKDISVKTTKIETTMWVNLFRAESCEYLFVNEIKEDTLDEYPEQKNPFPF